MWEVGKAKNSPPTAHSPRPFRNLSPSPERTGRACAWVEREDGYVLMAGLEWGGWTLPGGGIDRGESAAEAAVRELWEETGAHAEIVGEPFVLRGQSGKDADCFPMRLLRQDASPEGRPVRWVNPRSVWWASDPQLGQCLAALRRPAPAPDVAKIVRRIHRFGWVLKGKLSG